MTANHGDFIRGIIIKNLLHANKRIADEGTAKDVIRLSRFILKVSHKFDKELLELGLEECQRCDKNPPDECDEDITQTKGDCLRVKTDVSE